MATIGTLIVELAGNVARLETDLKQAGKHVQNTERLIQDSVNKMNGFFGLLGVTLSAGAFVHFIKGTIDSADALVDLHEKTGTSIKDLAGLKFAAEQNSTSLEAVAMAGKKLAVNLSEHPDLFRKFGVTAKDSTGAMIQLADVFANMPDGVQKTALAVKLMGKNGEEMIPFMNQGSASLRDYIDKGREYSNITEDSARKSKLFNDQIAELKAQSEGLGMQFANILVPTLASTATAMNDLVREGNPVLALWRGLAGMGKIQWDLLMPPENLAESLKSANRLKELKSELAGLENRLKETGGHGGLVGRWMHGTREEQLQQAEILKNQIATIERHAAELDKRVAAPPAAPKSGAQGGALLTGLGGGASDNLDEKDDQYWIEKAKKDYTRGEQQTFDLMNQMTSRFAELDRLAEESGATDLERVRMQEEQQLADLERQRMILATDHNLTLGEIQGFETAKLNIKKRAQAQKEQMGKAAFIQDLATLGKEMAVFMMAYKVAAVAEIMAAGGVRAEKSAAWAATWGGPPAAAAAFAISWAATLANAAMVSGLVGTGGGGGGGGASGGTGSVPMPESPLPSTIDATAPKPALMVNINIGNDGLYSATAVRNLIEKINEQIADGATIDQIRVN